MNLPICFIGYLMSETCHETTFTKIQANSDIQQLSQEELSLLGFRIKHFQRDHTGWICNHHKFKYLCCYENAHRKCYDPFSKHTTKSKTTELRTLTLETCLSFKQLKDETIVLIPGKKICAACRKIVSAKLKSENATTSNSSVLSCKLRPRTSNQLLDHANSSFQSDLDSQTPPSNSSSQNVYISSQEHREKIKDSLKRKLEVFNLVLPDSKKAKMSTSRVERKIIQVTDLMLEKILSEFNVLYKTNINLNLSEMRQNSLNLQALMHNMKITFDKKNMQEKIILLALLPQDWEFSKVKKELPSCTRYMYRKAIELKINNDAGLTFRKKSWKRISPEVIQSIKNFYRDETNCRICPGSKECKSVLNPQTNKKELLQKQLLLHTVKELYVMWKKDCPFEEIPSFSFFASLRPPECVLAGSPGTHTVCVCSEHQNVKLKLKALDSSLCYRNIFELGVCSLDNQQCMMHKCSNCPGKKVISDYLSNYIIDRETIKYQNWKSMDYGAAKSKEDPQTMSRVSLQSFTERSSQFLSTLVEELWTLMKHHYISETQKYYLSYLKRNLKANTCLILQDFAENYSFIAQESIQAFYFNNIQATVHPFGVYYKTSDDGELKFKSFCIISDDLKHNAATVNIFQEYVIKKIKEEFDWIEYVIYYSDGAPQQYKNKNYLINLCSHQSDFGVKVESHNFFATSHGKSCCDGIGAIVKRVVRSASLRMPPEKQILNPYDMYCYLKDNLDTVSVFWVPSIEVKARQVALKVRFGKAKTIQNTREYHYFKPLTEDTLEAKLTSIDQESKIVKVKK